MYDAYNYREDLNDIFANHNPQDPLFLYLPLHNVHEPFEAPTEWLDLYEENSTCDQRRTYQAMVSVADNVTALVVDWLKQTGMWENTLLVVSADNGGAPCGGSNYPLKGCKGTFFEGGVRALAFASGGLIPEEMQGKSLDGFIHIADWYPTFCKMAGVDSDDSGPGKFPVDGLDVWPLLTGEATKTSHDEIVLGYNFGRSNSGAIISGDYKLIVGSQKATCNSLMWSPLDYPCTEGPNGPDCDPYCLYNIVEDPEEKHDLLSTSSTILEQMLEDYRKFSQELREQQDQGYHTPKELPEDSNACKFMRNHEGYWQPWKDVDRRKVK